MVKNQDFFSANTNLSIENAADEIIRKNRELVATRKNNGEKTSLFFQDGKNILDHLAHYNFEYNGQDHFIGSNIVFIVGLPRCGKSSLEKLISSSLDDFYSVDEQNTVVEMLETIIAPDDKEYRYPEYLPYMTDAVFPDMAKDFFEKFSEGHNFGNKKIINTMPGNFIFIPLIVKMLPHCKIIWCHRQPSNHMLALFSKNFNRKYWNFSDDISELLEAYHLYKNIYFFYKTKLKDRFLDVSFDKLLSTPKEEIELIYKYLDYKNHNKLAEKTYISSLNLISFLKEKNDYLHRHLNHFPEFLNIDLFD